MRSLTETSLASGQGPVAPWSTPLAPAVRLRIAVGVGAVASLLVWIGYRAAPNAVSDWDQCWLAGRALLHGVPPYSAVNPQSSPWGLNYPFPAILISLPFTLLPLSFGRALFAGVGSGLLAYTLSSSWLGLLPFISGAYIWALFAVQWTPLLLAGVFLSWLSALFIVKPTTGLALWIAWPKRTAVLGALVLLGASFVIEPGWVSGWRAAVGTLYHIPPVLRPFGWILLLALLRWRDPRARLLAAFALIPQAGMPYDSLPLLLIPQSFLERAVFVGGTQLLAVYGLTIGGSPTPDSFAAELWPWTLGLVYVPALVMVLRRGTARQERGSSDLAAVG